MSGATCSSLHQARDAILRISEALSSVLTRQFHFARPVLGVTSGGFSDASTSLNVFLGPNERMTECVGVYTPILSY
jgi:hypothetical protein